VKKKIFLGRIRERESTFNTFMKKNKKNNIKKVENGRMGLGWTGCRIKYKLINID